MIHADISGKLGVPEDVLTSSCLGLMLLLPDERLIEILAQAHNLERNRIDLTGTDSVADFEFWPWLSDGGIPDVLLTLASNSRLRSVKVIIEVKHGSGKSGGGEDQLARYYRAALKKYPNHEVLLIYLTHHRDMPSDDLSTSIAQVTGTANMYWLSWHSVTRWCLENAGKEGLPISEYRIINTLGSYLSLKGYRCFHKLYLPAGHHHPIEPIYARKYTFKGDGVGQETCPIFVHSYMKSERFPNLSPLYENKEV